ncbi:MAG: hypothetical protein U0228_26425 [Myxococcaceae bacterium]
MELQPINLPELVGVTLGMMMVLIPIMGATVRFAARPLVEALLMSGVLGKKSQPEATPDVGRLTRRIVELEQEVALLKARSEPLADLPMSDLRRLRG